MLIAFHKPYGVLSQFTEDGSPNRPLSHFSFPKNVYPLGRLDADSEGLLLLTDEKSLNSKLLLPENAHRRTYWVQVEGIPSQAALTQLSQGVIIQGTRTRPALASALTLEIPPRVPPIRFRKNIPDSWIELTLTEGKNRQVRRMTAAVGHPTLRLIRSKIGKLELASLASGEWRELSPQERTLVFEGK